jgi:hypothetical protein
MPQTYVGLIFGASRVRWNSVPLPLDLTVIGMAGCQLAASYDLTVFGFADQAGVRGWSFPIPLDQGLVGQSFFNQALAVDPQANARGIVLSNARAGVIGSK